MNWHTGDILYATKTCAVLLNFLRFRVCYVGHLLPRVLAQPRIKRATCSTLGYDEVRPAPTPSACASYHSQRSAMRPGVDISTQVLVIVLLEYYLSTTRVLLEYSMSTPGLIALL